MPQPKMLTTAQVAEVLQVSVSSVNVWLSQEGHPRFPNAVKFGHVWQIPESDLESLPKGRKRGRPQKDTSDTPWGHASGIHVAINERLSATGKTADWLAKQTGIDHTTLAHICSNKNKAINLKFLRLICDALGCEPGDIILRKM